MANIKLKSLITEAEDFQARSKETGKLVHFKSKDAYQAALKAGTHEDPKAKKGGEPKAAAKPNDMFGGDYTKDRGGDTSSNRKWVNYDKDHSIDTNSGMIVPKGKESDTPNPKDIKGIDSINTSKVNLPKKASQLNYKHAEVLEKALNAEAGLDGYVDTDDNTDAIMFHGTNTISPTYTIYFGGNDDYGKPDEFRVSLLPTYGNDPAGLEDAGIDKTFKSAEEAMAFAVEIAKKYKKELQMDDDDEVPTDEPKVRPQSKVQDFVKNLSGKQYKEFAFDNDIDHRDPMEMQDFIQSLSDEEAEEILKKYGKNESTKLTSMIKR